MKTNSTYTRESQRHFMCPDVAVSFSLVLFVFFSFCESCCEQRTILVRKNSSVVKSLSIAFFDTGICFISVLLHRALRILSAVPGCLWSLVTSDQTCSDHAWPLSCLLATVHWVNWSQISVSVMHLCPTLTPKSVKLKYVGPLSICLKQQIDFSPVFSFILHSFISPFCLQNCRNKLTSRKHLGYIPSADTNCDVSLGLTPTGNLILRFPTQHFLSLWVDHTFQS